MDDFDINKRIIQLVDDLDTTRNQFARDIGISSSRMSNITTLRNRPDSEMLKAIALTFTNVSLDWLIVGRGGMYKDSTNAVTFQIPTDIIKEPVQTNGTPIICEKCLMKDELIESLRQHVTTLKDQNQFLKESKG